MAVGAISNLHRPLIPSLSIEFSECCTPSLSLKAGNGSSFGLATPGESRKVPLPELGRSDNHSQGSSAFLAFSILRLLSTLNVSKAPPQSLTNRPCSRLVPRSLRHISGGSVEFSQVVNACRSLLQSPGYLGAWSLLLHAKAKVICSFLNGRLSPAPPY